jgi:DNA-3-methyladenine glycosylase I
MAAMSDAELEFLLQDPGIIRNRLKVFAARKNAQAYLKVEETHLGGFSNFLWQHIDGKPVINTITDHSQIPTKTVLSDKISKELNKAGFGFCGSVTIYAMLQAAGLVNDHLLSCHCHPQNG